MNTFSYILSDYQLIERIKTKNPDDYILKFVNEEGGHSVSYVDY